MGRKAILESYLSVEEIEHRYRGTKEYPERKWWQVIYMVAKGWQLKDASEAAGLSYSTGKRWLKRYNQEGPEALRDRRKSRSEKLPVHSLLTPEQTAELFQKLRSERPPDGGLWTGAKVACLIAEMTGREFVWAQRGCDYLRRLGFTLRRPRRRHVKADPEEQEAFKRRIHQTVERVKAQHKSAEVSVWAFDEHRVGLKPIIRRVWMPKDEPAIAPVHPRYEWLYLYSFVCPATGENFWLIMPVVNTEAMSLALREFAQQMAVSKERRVVLVMDRAGWHVTSGLEVPEGVDIEFLPAYSPELQPVERMWELSDEPLANRAFKSLKEMEEVLVERCKMLMGMQDVVRKRTLFHWWPRQ
jgi:transposase